MATPVTATALEAGPRDAAIADTYRGKLVEWYGETGTKVMHAEVFEVCEYGHQPTREEIKKLFPFFTE